MELPEELESMKKCYKFANEIFDNFNINYNASSSMVILWNKYQIFVYEDMNFEIVWKIFVPEFQVHQVIMSPNYLVCLDKSGNIQTSSLKFKNPAQKRFKSNFQPREQQVMVCTQIEDCIVSLKYHRNIYILNTNKMNADFSLESKKELKYKGRWPLPKPTQSKSILVTHKLKADEIEYIKNIFEIDSANLNNVYLVVLSLDKITVYGCVYSPMWTYNDVNIKKLYTCPSEICNMEILGKDSLHILVGLNIGTLIKFSLKNILKAQDVIHLNTALHKYFTMQDTIIYTDGDTMWKSEKSFSNNITFSKFYMRQVKDFIKVGDQIFCTTFTNMLYIFPVDHESSYTCNNTTNEYKNAELLLNNSDYLYKIMENMDNTTTLINKINMESICLSALSLSKRQDVMESMLQYNIIVYQKYEDVIKDNSDITLTEQRNEYFKPSTFLILFKLNVLTSHNLLNDILTNIHSDVKIHISISSDTKLLKTTSLKVTKNFKNMNLLIPCEILHWSISLIKVNLKLIASIPGAYDERQKLWITLYRKKSILSSEFFMKTHFFENNPCTSLKEPAEPLADIIYKKAMLQYGNIFSITDVSKYHANALELSVYAKLPSNYIDVFKNAIIRIDNISHIPRNSAEFFVEHLKVDEFLKSDSYLYFAVAETCVKFEVVINAYAHPVMRVSSMNFNSAFYMKNLLAQLIYNDCSDFAPNKVYYPYSIHNVIENLQKEIKDCVLKHGDYVEFKDCADQFEKLVLGTLPL